MTAIAATKERALGNLVVVEIRWPFACSGVENNLDERDRGEKNQGREFHCSLVEGS
jgi:hypothetical protein